MKKDLWEIEYDTEFMLNKIEAELLGRLKFFLFGEDKKNYRSYAYEVWI